MRILGGQFVLGRTIDEALAKARAEDDEQGYRFSFDMLGEAARTADDADALCRALSRGGGSHRRRAGTPQRATSDELSRGPGSR